MTQLAHHVGCVRCRGTSLARRAAGYDEVIYLIAPTGFPNYGDEVIARAWLTHLALTRPRATVVLDCYGPGQACLLLRDVHPRALFVDTLWQLMQFANHVDPEESGDTADPDSVDTGLPDPRALDPAALDPAALDPAALDPAALAPAALDPAAPWEWVARAATDPGLAPRLAEGIDLLGRASTLHFLGGGYLNRIWPERASLVIAAAEVARGSGARLVATGQGLIPRVEGEIWAPLARALESFTVLDVRDRESARLFEDRRPVLETGDDAWLTLAPHISRRHPTYAPVAGAASNGGVILCLQGDLTEDFESGGLRGPAAMADYVARILDAWEVPGEVVTVIEGIPGIDFQVPALLGDRIAGCRVIPLQEMWRRGLPAGAGQTWISTRFHPHLLAAAAGDSGVAIATRADYYSIKHKLLTDVGSQWTVVSDSSTVPERPTAGGVGSDDRTLAITTKTALAQALYPHWPRRLR